MAHPGGRPSLYKPEYCDLAYKFCLLGATDADLARMLEVEESTINNWKKDFPEFLESLKRGKEIADANVAKALYHRAIGFKHDDVEVKVVANGDNMGSRIELVPVEKIYPPDTGAAMAWLKNRQKDKWQDKTVQDVNISGTIGLADRIKRGEERLNGGDGKSDG